jgi:DNA (cytosine-5)-methyltransferase 3A
VQVIETGVEKANAVTCTQKDSMVSVFGRCRRFTPIEVERLFTLPDNYTSGVSESQRYRLLGNGWVVDQLVDIFKHIEQ